MNEAAAMVEACDTGRHPDIYGRCQDQAQRRVMPIALKASSWQPAEMYPKDPACP